MPEINDKTKVPIGLAVVAIGGGAIWLTTLYFQTSANAKSIANIEQKQSAIDSIQTDIAVIKEQVSEIRQDMKNNK